MVGSSLNHPKENFKKICQMENIHIEDEYDLKFLNIFGADKKRCQENNTELIENLFNHLVEQLGDWEDVESVSVELLNGVLDSKWMTIFDFANNKTKETIKITRGETQRGYLFFAVVNGYIGNTDSS